MNNLHNQNENLPVNDVDNCCLEVIKSCGGFSSEIIIFLNTIMQTLFAFLPTKMYYMYLFVTIHFNLVMKLGINLF